MMKNPVVYFEIPVRDLDNAISFYEKVFGYTFEKTIIDHYEMALFPFSETREGISGALVKGDVYQPTTQGVILYFHSDDIEQTLDKAMANGGELLYPKTSNGDLGYVAEFKDCEGNRIALNQPAETMG